MKYNKNIIEIAQKRIDLEMKRVGYIEDSDLVDRFIDNLAYDLVSNKEDDNEIEGIIELIKENCMDKYNRIYHIDKYSNYIGFYVPKDSKYKDVDDIIKNF